MKIYFQDGIKYVQVANCGIAYKDATTIFHQMRPRYIKTFVIKSHSDELEIVKGFNAFCEACSGIYGLIEALENAEISGEYILYQLTAKLFPEMERWEKRRRVIKRQHTLIEWQTKLAQYNYKCAYCGQGEFKLEKDHIVPLSKGGSDKIINLVPACRWCNARKSDKFE